MKHATSAHLLSFQRRRNKLVEINVVILTHTLIHQSDLCLRRDPGQLWDLPPHLNQSLLFCQSSQCQKLLPDHKYYWLFGHEMLVIHQTYNKI